MSVDQTLPAASSPSLPVGPATDPHAAERLRDETWWYGSAAMAAFIVLWEVLVAALDVPELYLPRPSVIVRTLWEMFAQKELAYDTAITLYRIFAGFALAALVGVALGV